MRNPVLELHQPEKHPFGCIHEACEIWHRAAHRRVGAPRQKLDSVALTGDHARMTPTSGGRGEPVTAAPARRRRRLRALILAALLGLVATAVPMGLVLFPHDDEPRSPDAIVVLGGVGQERADLGIVLSELYDVPLVLSSSATWFASQRGYRCSFGNAMCLQRPFAESTAEEARDTLAFLDERGWDHVTVVTSSHHTARARILFRQCLDDRVTVVGAPRPESIPDAERDLPWTAEGVSVRAQAREVAGIVAAVTVRRAC
jgi:uncharacterized SAM-binding protein YcdF (DUF218 family)